MDFLQKLSANCWLFNFPETTRKDNAILAELAAANAVYATIKTFVLNGRETTEVLSPLKNLVTSEEELRARGNRKKNGLFSKVMGKAADDDDVFGAGANG